eukprot:TRINITY_DN4569_c0_g1_i3.p1 TRINITY_DN4569_c0_g1~~TRINITY_DN4569_c0_g1_i3.p1  ORF type:complete len:478 (+),score=84.92 TRINITY_DN4569_c0_g1_i3:1307-2740(+)
MRYSIHYTRVTRTVLLSAKILGFVMVSACFGLDKAMSRKYDHCEVKDSLYTRAVQALMKGIVSAVFADGLTAVLAMVPRRLDIDSLSGMSPDEMIKEAGCIELRARIFKVLAALHIAGCVFMLMIFMANVSQSDIDAWLLGTLIAALQLFLVMPFFTAATQAVLCSWVFLRDPEIARNMLQAHDGSVCTAGQGETNDESVLGWSFAKVNAAAPDLEAARSSRLTFYEVGVSEAIDESHVSDPQSSVLPSCLGLQELISAVSNVEPYEEPEEHVGARAGAAIIHEVHDQAHLGDNEGNQSFQPALPPETSKENQSVKDGEQIQEMTTPALQGSGPSRSRRPEAISRLSGRVSADSSTSWALESRRGHIEAMGRLEQMQRRLACRLPNVGLHGTRSALDEAGEDVARCSGQAEIVKLAEADVGQEDGLSSAVAAPPKPTPKPDSSDYQVELCVLDDEAGDQTGFASSWTMRAVQTSKAQ